MRESYAEYFAKERDIRTLVQRAGVEKSRVKTLTANLMRRRPAGAPGLLARAYAKAHHPFPREQALVVGARLLLEKLEPAFTPSLNTIEIAHLHGPYGVCGADDTIRLDPDSPMMKSAEQGDLLPLALVIHHENFHAQYGKDEQSAYAASLKFCSDHNAPPELVATVESARDYALRTRTPKLDSPQLRTNVYAAEGAAPMNTLRTRHAAGKRNSQRDQDNLDSALAAIIEAGATHNDNPTAADAGASPEHQAKLDACYAALISAGAEADDTPTTTTSDGKTRPPWLSVSSRHLSEPPNPYAKATARAASIREAQSPTTDPDYDPRGAAPDGYAIGIALRTALASDAAPSPRASMPRDTNGTPNPYSPEAIARHQRAREARTV